MNQTTKPLPHTAHKEEHEELSAVERWMDKLGPHMSKIALALALCFLAFIAIVYLVKSKMDSNESQWQQLNSSMIQLDRTGNSAGLREVADAFPGQKAGLWAALLAGDNELRVGINQLTYDRDGGLEMIGKARDLLQQVVDAPADEKTTMLQRRSVYTLAYATESLGEFVKAKELYQSILEAAPDSSFADAARRGVERSSNPQFVAIFEEFKNFQEGMGDAPGPAIPDRPDISFPGDIEFDDDVDSSDDSATEENAESNSPKAEQPVVKTESEKTESGKTESEKTESEKTESVKTESDKSDAELPTIEDKESVTSENASDNE